MSSGLGLPNSSGEVGKQGCLLRVAADMTQSLGSPYVPLEAQEEHICLQTQVRETCSAAQADPELRPRVLTTLKDTAHQNPLPPDSAPSLTSWASCPRLCCAEGKVIRAHTTGTSEGFVTKNIQ